MRCLGEHTPKSEKGQYTKFCPLIARDLRKRAKIILKLIFLIRKLVLKLPRSYSFLLERKACFKKKPKSTIKQRKTAKKPKHLILVTLVGRKRRKICRPTSEAIGQGTNTISKTPYLTRQQFISKNQRALSNRKTTKLSKIWFWVHCLADLTPRFVTD